MSINYTAVLITAIICLTLAYIITVNRGGKK